MPAFLPFLMAAPAVASAISGSRANARANRAQQQALDFEREKWNAGQPFRARGAAMLGQEVDPAAMSALFTDQGNPYAAGQTFQPLMRASQAGGAGADPSRTARPRATPDGYTRGEFADVDTALGGGMRPPTVGPTMSPMMAPMVAPDMTQGGDDMAQRRAALASFAQMAPQLGGRRMARRGGL